jgi:hypothetical protein
MTKLLTKRQREVLSAMLARMRVLVPLCRHGVLVDRNCPWCIANERRFRRSPRRSPPMTKLTK